MKVAQATCNQILAYQIPVFSIHVDQLPKYGSVSVTAYCLCKATEVKAYRCFLVNIANLVCALQSVLMQRVYYQPKKYKSHNSFPQGVPKIGLRLRGCCGGAFDSTILFLTP